MHFDCRENIFFAEGLSDIEQLCLGSMCNHFILSNSTFAWWQAYLGQREDSIVIHPHTYFKGDLAKYCNTDDFWKESWTEYKWEKIDATDVTFTIPVHYDHPQRLENLNLIMDFLHASFDTKIIVGEQGGNEFALCIPRDSYYNYRNMEQFHRTKMLNHMARESDTQYIVNYDADNIVAPLQMCLAFDALREGADVVYPYDGRCARVEREHFLYALQKNKGDIGVLKGITFRGCRKIDPLSVGHIIIWNKDSFFKAGGENENFISYGPEDVERVERAGKLQLSIKRIKGITYHIDHYCGTNSSGSNPYFGDNYNELYKIQKMTKQELEQYINSWPWVEKVKNKQSIYGI